MCGSATFYSEADDSSAESFVDRGLEVAGFGVHFRHSCRRSDKFGLAIAFVRNLPFWHPFGEMDRARYTWGSLGGLDITF